MSGNFSSNQVLCIEQRRNQTDHDKSHQDQVSQMIFFFLIFFRDAALTSPAPAPFDFQHDQEGGTTNNGEAAAWPSRKMTGPPRLLICYSSCDGPAHVKAVMQLGAFIQQHMATQVGQKGRQLLKRINQSVRKPNSLSVKFILHLV